MSAGWTCLECPVHGDEPNWAVNDRQAEKHTRQTSHGTRTWTTGAARVRDGERVRDLKPAGTSP